MEDLLFELVVYIILLMDFEDKINLYLTSKKYKFVLEYVYNIPTKYKIDSKILKFVNLTSLNLSNNNLITNENIQSLNLTSFDNDLDPFFMGLFENTGEIHDLLKRNGFFERDQNNIHQKAQDDMQVKFLSGDVDYTNQYVDECNADMLAILKEEYVPNFSYMGK